MAVSILMRIEKDNAYSNITLSSFFKDTEITSEEKAFVAALVYGVLDRKITLDYVLSNFLKTPIKKTAPFTLNVLRTALYQIMYMDKIPESAAVNEAVKLIKKSKESRNQGFVNAILRSVLRSGDLIPQDNSENSLSIRYSTPLWIVKSFLNDYGIDDTVALLEESLKVAPFTLRVNTLKTDKSALADSFLRLGINTVDGIINDSIILEKGIDVLKNDAFKKGYFHVEDLASQIAVSRLCLKPYDRVLDICAAPGGKTFTMAEIMENKGEIIACDLYEQRVKLISDGAFRLGISIIKPIVNDALKYNSDIGVFDKVLCDVPCSGLGVIRRKPDIKYKEDSDFSSLESIGEQILKNSAKYLKNGGLLLYSTCTLRKNENENQVVKFLKENSTFTLLEQKTLMPHKDKTDGFYYALLKKEA